MSAANPSFPSSSALPEPSGSQSAEDLGSFERWRRSAAWITGLGLTPEQEAARAKEQVRKNNESQWEQCQKWKTDLMWNSPAIGFMRKHMALLGQPVTPEQLSCQPCSAIRGGGMAKDGSILLCQNRIWDKQKMEDTIMHELVHAYDRAKFDLDLQNCRHHACTEIRANNLSGDCKWNREVTRGFFGFTKQHQACVRRRALMSLAQNPACSAPGVAERAVDDVWESCIKDTRPFDEIF
ncbi:mitochondrial inner membrane protease ATP23 [Calocera viscosa TUFC12733]|uniref:Mitochondrial inner membrane protease ATP23 n=1 Tax=Calocera viscosa (strain TUFC12733) TaxID=1330018 RepID=A0A167JY48_CALVF|nr:mitochondrial inner membrane protease ATP23 [Calocera viscosa TUFC12733]